MKRSGPVVGLSLMLVFLSGALVGAFAHRLYSARTVSAKGPDAYRQRYLNEMQTRLKLDPAQMEALVKILDESKDRYKQARERIDPEMKQIQREQRDKIRAILSPDQKIEYERLLEEKDKRRREGTQRGC